MSESFRVELNGGAVHAVDAPAEFTAQGPFHVELHNVGGPIHVHLRLDDDLSRAARLDGGNHYVESETVKRVPVGIVAGDRPVSGRLEIISGYGAETAQVAVTVAEDPGGGRAGTTATERQPRSRNADAGGSDSPPTAGDAGASSATRTSEPSPATPAAGSATPAADSSTSTVDSATSAAESPTPATDSATRPIDSRTDRADTPVTGLLPRLASLLGSASRDEAAFVGLALVALVVGLGIVSAVREVLLSLVVVGIVVAVLSVAGALLLR